MIPVNKSVENYQVIAPDGSLSQEVTSVVIKSMTDQSYICDLYAGEECVAVDRRFAFADMICNPLSTGETGLIVGESPTAEWSDDEIKMYIDHNAIEYTNETGMQLIALIPLQDEGE